MSAVNIPVQPIVLAVIIGLLDLLLVEVYKTVFGEAQKVNLRYQLCNHGQAIIQKKRRKQLFSLSTVVFFGQFLILSSAIWLELSISSIELPSRNFVSSCCITPERLTKTIDRTIPEPAEVMALGPFILPYIEKSGCHNSLVTNITRGTSEYTSSFLPCLPSFRKRPLNISLRLQGSAIGHVATDMEGDPTVVYGMTSEDGSTILGEDSEFGDSLFQGTTFFGTLFFSHNSTSFWRGESSSKNEDGQWDYSERIISNAMIPQDFLNEAPTEYNESNTGYQNCAHNDLACFREFAQIAHRLKTPIEKTLKETRGAVVVTSHRHLPSSICILTDTLKSAVSWVRMEQFINDTNTKRKRRAGPVPTMIKFSGSAMCVDDIGQNVSRLYSDVLDRGLVKHLVEFRENGTSMLNATANTQNCGSCQRTDSENCDNNFAGESLSYVQSDFETIRVALQWAVVAKGMMTESGEEVNCKTYAVLNGSSIGKVELFFAIIIGVAIISCVAISCVITLGKFRKCPLRVDPLNVKEMLQHLLKVEDSHRRMEGETPWEEASDPIVLTLGQQLREERVEIGAYNELQRQDQNERRVEISRNINYDMIRGNPIGSRRNNMQRESENGELVLSVRKFQGRFVLDFVL